MVSGDLERRQEFSALSRHRLARIGAGRPDIPSDNTVYHAGIETAEAAIAVKDAKARAANGGRFHRSRRCPEPLLFTPVRRVDSIDGSYRIDCE